MNISIGTLLEKMEAELKRAKNSEKQEILREKIYSIKILCELILEDGQSEQGRGFSVTPPPTVVPQQPVYNQPVTLIQPKKLDEGEANGDSLFDF